MVEGLLEHVEFDGVRLATIMRSGFSAEGIVFVTPDEATLQLGFMRRPTGYLIPAHVHTPVERTVSMTQEVLFIRSGYVRVDLFDVERRHVATRTLGPLDVILLCGGGHCFEIIGEAEIIEVKQGPFVGEHDKVRFDAVRPLTGSLQGSAEGSVGPVHA